MSPTPQHPKQDGRPPRAPVGVMSTRTATRKRTTARVGIEEMARDSGLRYRGMVYDRVAAKHIRGPWTESLAEARAWRIDALAAVRAGRLTARRGPTISAAVDEWMAGARAGLIETRSGEPYKPATLRSYEQGFNKRVIPALGERHLREITRPELQQLVARWRKAGMSPSRIRNSINGVRALYRHAMTHTDLHTNPTIGLALPAVRGQRDHVVAPEQAARLIDALDHPESAIWALAVYAGLRLGEIRALRWTDIDLTENVLHITRGWDQNEGEIAPKSRAGTRDIPIYRPLRAQLTQQRLRSNPDAVLVFPADRNPLDPFSPNQAYKHARQTWATEGLEPLGLHEARHCAASFMIAAGLNLKAISTFMGHSTITVTLDRYGHLLPGSRDEAQALMDSYLERPDGIVTRGLS